MHGRAEDAKKEMAKEDHCHCGIPLVPPRSLYACQGRPPIGPGRCNDKLVRAIASRTGSEFWLAQAITCEKSQKLYSDNAQNLAKMESGGESDSSQEGDGFEFGRALSDDETLQEGAQIA